MNIIYRIRPNISFSDSRTVVSFGICSVFALFILANKSGVRYPEVKYGHTEGKKCGYDVLGPSQLDEAGMISPFKRELKCLP